jgi:hydrogenase small subunit
MPLGLSRREFLTYCGRLAALAALGPSAGLDVARALEGAARVPRVVWSSFAECGGCTVSLLASEDPSPAGRVLSRISLDYHEMLMNASGTEATRRFEDILARGEFIYVVEGAIPVEVPDALLIGGRPAREIAIEAASRARVVVAAGNCAAYGGIPAAKPNPTGCVGLREALTPARGPASRGAGAAAGVASGGRVAGGYASHPPVISIPTCPANGEALLAVLAHALTTGGNPELDALGRPLFLYGETIHDSCRRRGHFENGEFLGSWGLGEEAAGWCLLHVGCKGPQTKAPCARLGWNSRRVSCVDVGPCIGCAEPAFWDRFAPLALPSPGSPAPGLAGVSPEKAARATGVAAGLGVGAHFVGEAAAGRLPWRPDEAEEPA